MHTYAHRMESNVLYVPLSILYIHKYTIHEFTWTHHSVVQEFLEGTYEVKGENQLD